MGGWLSWDFSLPEASREEWEYYLRFDNNVSTDGKQSLIWFANVMLTEGTEPAAWAPAEGETLAGGGALMSANLLDGIAPTLVSGTTESDGVWHNVGRTSADGHDDWLVWDLAGQSALATNQMYHVGLSTMGASANSASLHATIGYRDAAGNANWATSDPRPIGTSWGRAESAIVVPSGMTPFAFYVAAYGECPETWMASPTLSCGSPVTLASDAHTPYATQDHVAAEYATKAALKVTSDAVTAEVTERGKLAGRVGTLESTTGTHTSKLSQLAASITSLVKGESTYTDPDGKSATSGIYSLVTQTRDSVTALFSSYTKTADLASTTAVKDAKKAGTDAASAASAAQSTADAAKANAATAQSTADTASSAAASAQSTADVAKSTADSLSTLIRADSSGVTVGKSEDGATWSTGRTRQTADAFEVLSKAGEVLSSFGAKVVELGKNSQDATISMLAGLATIVARKFGAVSGIEMSANGIGLQATSGSMNIHSHFPSTGRGGVGQVDVTTALVSEEPMLTVYVADTTDKREDGVSIGVTPFGVTTNHPEYLRSAIGSYGPVSPSSPYGSLTFCVRAGVATLWVSWGTTADPWAKMQCGEWVVPKAYRPKFDLWCPVALENRGSGDTGDTVLIIEASTGRVYWQNRGGGHSATTFNALVSWGIE